MVRERSTSTVARPEPMWSPAVAAAEPAAASSNGPDAEAMASLAKAA
jgi:hypothetical protein